MFLNRIPLKGSCEMFDLLRTLHIRTPKREDDLWQWSRHTKDVIKMAPVVPLFSTEQK